MQELRIYNRNIFGVPIFARRHAERIDRMAKQAKEGGSDILLLQEVLMPMDRLRVRNLFGGVYNIFRANHSYFRLGGGLCSIFNKSINSEASFVRFRSSGFLTDLTIVDKIAEKGFQVFKIGHPIEMTLINTHLTCPYEKILDSNIPKKELMADQINSILEYINTKVLGPVVVCGDFNLEPRQDLMINFIRDGRLQDRSAHLRSTILGNYYSPRWLFQSQTSEKKVDYVLTRDIPKDWEISVEAIIDNGEIISDHTGLIIKVRFNNLNSL